MVVFTALTSFVSRLQDATDKVNNGNNGGTARENGSFSSNVQRIYFTGTSESNTEISCTEGSVIGMMMGGRLACVSCHGINAEGGRHMMHMEIMDAPDIRWSALASGHHDEEV